MKQNKDVKVLNEIEEVVNHLKPTIISDTFMGHILPTVELVRT